MPRVAAIDIETTGLYPEVSQIYQIGIAYCEIPGKLFSYFLQKTGSWNDFEEALLNHPNFKGVLMTTCPEIKTHKEIENSKKALAVGGWTIEELENLPIPGGLTPKTITNSSVFEGCKKLHLGEYDEFGNNLLLENECSLLREYWYQMNNLKVDIVIGHNYKQFDSKFKETRSKKYSLKHDYLDHCRIIDTKEQAINAGYNPSNLSILAERFGIVNERPHNGFFDALTSLKLALRVFHKSFLLD